MEKEKEESILKKYHIYLIFGLILLAILFPTVILFLLYNKVSFSNSGSFGDTVGGLSAPFIGCVGAILVYLSFKEQIEANKIQKRSLDEEKKRNELNRLFDAIVKDIYKLEDYINQFSYNNSIGLDAIKKYTELLNDKLKNRLKINDPFKGLITSAYFINIKQYCDAFLNIFYLIENANFSKEQKKILFTRMAFIYNWKFRDVNMIFFKIYRQKDLTNKYRYVNFIALINKFDALNDELLEIKKES